jgi:hypothetical protein
VLLPGGCQARAAAPDGLPTSGSPCCRSCTIQTKFQIKNIACDVVVGCSWAGVVLHCCCTIFDCTEPFTPSVALALSVMSAFLSPSLFLSLNWGSLSNSETSLGQRTARFVPSFKPRKQSLHVIKPDAPDTQWVKGGLNAPSLVPDSWPHQQSQF